MKIFSSPKIFLHYRKYYLFHRKVSILWKIILNEFESLKGSIEFNIDRWKLWRCSYIEIVNENSRISQKSLVIQSSALITTVKSSHILFCIAFSHPTPDRKYFCICIILGCSSFKSYDHDLSLIVEW